MSAAEFEALVSLLDDPDANVYSNVSERLIAYGPDALPLLERKSEHVHDDWVQTRIKEISRKINFDQVHQSLHQWVVDGGNDLLEGALIVAKYEFPDLDEDQIRQEFGRFRTDIWIELNDNLTALEKVRVMNHIIFDVHGFKGNAKNLTSPENSFINKVLDNRKGNPLSMGLIYCILAKDLHLPIFGVNLPEHFILAYLDENGSISNGEAVLFYINAYNRGSVFNRPEVYRFLSSLNVEPKEHHILPCDNIKMVNRLVNNLMMSYDKAGDATRVDEMRELQQAFLIQ